MSKQKTFIASLMLVGGVVFAPAHVGASPNEGACDELMGGTPGLYGLCVAFSEGQECVPDFSLDNPFENCRPSDPKLVEIYHKKSEWYDPPMPGLGNPCPCWLPPELEGLRYPVPTDFTQCAAHSGINTYDGWAIGLTGGGYQSVASTVFRADGPICIFVDLCNDDSCLNVSRTFRISWDEATDCAAEVIEAGIERGFDCWD